MRKIITCILLAVLASVTVSSAQGLKDIRINEVLVVNEDSYADDFAKHVSWIELFNSGYSSVNIGGAYLTVKLGDQTRTYRIPKNDSRTYIAPQGYAIFFADGSSNKGTFHTNFTLDETGYLAFLDQGANIVDEIKYDVTAQRPDISIGKLKANKKITFESLGSVTPMQANETTEVMRADEKFRLADPSGIVMSITAMTVVFLALIVLYIIFKQVGKYNIRLALRKENAVAGDSAMPAVTREPSGEEIAAIALALQFWETDLIEQESAIITINRVAKAYSPWSSKIYTLTQLPNRKR